MAPRTCPSCGTDVSTASAFCPKCGADLEAKLIELGGPTPVRAKRTPQQRSPKRRRLLAGVAAVVVGGLAVTTLVGDDGDGDEGDGSEEDGGGGEATTTTLADLSDRAPLLREESDLSVVIRGQALVRIDLDDGSIDEVGPFEPSSATSDAFVAAGNLGVQVWPAPYAASIAYVLDELGAETAVLGETVAWAIEDGVARALRRDEVGVVAEVALPSGARPIGAVVDTLIVAAPGGAFAIGVDGAAVRVSEGTPIAAAHGLLAATVCNDDLACVVQTLDRDGTVIQTVPLTGDRAVTAASVAPDGRVAWIVGVPGDGEVVVDGRPLTPLPSAATATLDWSPDGRWLVGSFGRDNLWVFDSSDPLRLPGTIELGRSVYPEEIFVVEN